MELQKNLRHLLWSLGLLAVTVTGWPIRAEAKGEKGPSSQPVPTYVTESLDRVPATAEASTTAPTMTGGGNELTDLSLEDLMNVEVTSVSKKKESIADAPAAVTLIDQDTIARSGFSTILLRGAHARLGRRRNCHSLCQCN